MLPEHVKGNTSCRQEHISNSKISGVLRMLTEDHSIIHFNISGTKNTQQTTSETHKILVNGLTGES